jgi:uncharacterized protein YjbI with pentapeptide repeats
MANDDQLAQLMKGVDAWNAWRQRNVQLDEPDLAEANLSGADLCWADLRGAKLRGANLRRTQLLETNLWGANLGGSDLSDAYVCRANLIDANLRGANLRGAEFSDAELRGADLRGVDLRRVDLRRVDLTRANLSGANLSEANLEGADLSWSNLTEAELRGASLVATTLVETDLTDANLTGCSIYGISAWGLKLERTKQQNLVITRDGEPEITVDNVEVAQFVYLLLHNEKIRDVVDTITSKAVLILGRFTDERKAVLDALRENLRGRNYLPILFDFDKPTSQTTDETITLLARMSRFVIADISDAKSVLQELRAIVPDLPSVPVQPIILAMQEEPGMFDFYRNFRSFLNVHRYASQEQLIVELGEKVIRPAELKVLDLQSSTSPRPTVRVMTGIIDSTPPAALAC